MIKIIASIFGSSIMQHFKNIFEKFVGASNVVANENFQHIMAIISTQQIFSDSKVKRDKLKKIRYGSRTYL